MLPAGIGSRGGVPLVHSIEYASGQAAFHGGQTDHGQNLIATRTGDTSESILGLANCVGSCSGREATFGTVRTLFELGEPSRATAVQINLGMHSASRVRRAR